LRGQKYAQQKNQRVFFFLNLRVFMKVLRRSQDRFLRQKFIPKPKTLFEIGSFEEQRLFSVKFARFRNFFDFARFGESWNPTNCEKFNSDGSLMGRANLDKPVW